MDIHASNVDLISHSILVTYIPISGFYMTSSKYNYANFDQVAPNFDLGYMYRYKAIQHVSVPNLKSFGPMKTELWSIEIEELFIMLYCCLTKISTWSAVNFHAYFDRLLSTFLF